MREVLKGMHAAMKERARLKARVDSGVDVVIEIRDSGKAA